MYQQTKPNQFLNLIIALLLFCFAGCQTGERTKSDFPQKIANEKTEKHQRVPGTRISLIVPEQYEFVPTLSRYQKEDRLYLMVMETTASNLTLFQETFSKDSLEGRGGRIDVYEEIRIGAYAGIYTEGPSEFPDYTKIGIIFGDGSFNASIIGLFENGNPASKAELQEIFKSVHYDSDFDLDPLELAIFTFDTSILGYEFKTSVGNTFSFGPPGESDDSDPRSLTLSTAPPMLKEEGFLFFKDLLRKLELQGGKIDLNVLTETEIGGILAFRLETLMEQSNRVAFLYQVMILSGKGTIFMMATCAPGEKEKFRPLFERTAASIKYK